MKEKAIVWGKRILTHELISGSSILFIGSTFANFLAFLFNLFVVRHFSYTDYGEYAAVLSLITLLTIPSQSITPVIIRYASSYASKNDINSLASFYHKTFRLFLFLGIAVFLLFLAFSGLIQSFLHIQNFPLMIATALVIGGMYISIVNASFIQGLLLFSFISFTTVLGGVIKLVFGIGAINMGWGVVGVITVIFLAFLIPYLSMFLPLRHLWFHKQKSIAIPIKEITLYAIPTLITLFSLSSFTSTDVLLVKHFFSTSQAGLYAGLSLVGRVIFYFTAPITSVMFPLVVKRHEQGTNFRGLLYVALLLVLLPSLGITLFYFIFPHFVIGIFLGGKGYYQMSGYIGWYGLFLTLFSVLSVLVNFFLSLKRTEVIILVALGALSQAVGIALFHSSFTSVVSVSLVTSFGLLLLLLLYYYRVYATHKSS